MRRTCSLLAALMCGAATLAACQKPANAPPPPLAALPPTTDAPPLQLGPADYQLPPAPAPRLLRVSNRYDDYAFADRAYAMDIAFADAPPDYDFVYDGASPWVWVADDGSECVAELTPYGWRYYYFDPGIAEPFFIADPDYDYGFENGGLVVIYDREGRVLPFAGDPAPVQLAGQFLARATDLRQAAAHDPHRAISAADWAQNRNVISGQRRVWSQAAATDPSFQAYRAQHAAEDAAHWNGEQLRREAWAARVDAGLGDRGRAQAEWQAAAAQSSRIASTAGGHGPNWSGWQAGPPPVGAGGAHGGAAPSQLARNETRTPAATQPFQGAPGLALSGADHGRQPGRFASNSANRGCSPSPRQGPDAIGWRRGGEPRPASKARRRPRATERRLQPAWPSRARTSPDLGRTLSRAAVPLSWRSRPRCSRTSPRARRRTPTRATGLGSAPSTRRRSRTSRPSRRLNPPRTSRLRPAPSQPSTQRRAVGVTRAAAAISATATEVRPG